MKQATSYRADIDGMRAVAVAAVVIYHAFPGVLQHGFLGVDIFFVLSGFLITGILSDDLAAGRFSIGKFYARRARRIAPALLLVLAGSFALGWTFLLPLDYRQFGAHMIGGALFFANIQFWLEVGYFDKAANLKPLLHLWSLSVEEQFYLLWPWLLLWFGRIRPTALKMAILIAILSFGTQVFLEARDPGGAFYLPVPRFWELMLGAVVALWPRDHPRYRARLAAIDPIWKGAAAALCLGMVVASLAIGGPDGAAPAWWVLVPTGGTALLIAFGRNNRFSDRVLGARGMVGLGRISYPLYLWHWPLLVFLRIAHSGEPSVRWRLGIIGLSVVLAWLTYVGIERPVRLGSRRVWLAPALALCLVGMSLIGFADYRGNGFAFRIPEPLRDYVSRPYDYAAGARVGKCWLPADARYDGFASTCFGSRAGSSRKNVLVWGDSHAARLYVGIANDYSRAFNVEQLTRDSCPPILAFSYPVCVQSNAHAISLIQRAPPDLVIMFAVWNRYEPDLRAGREIMLLKATLERLKAINVPHILVVGPAPQWNEALPSLLASFWRAHLLDHPSVPAVMKLGLEESPFDVDRLLRESIPPGLAAYASLIDLLCNSHGCQTRTGSGMAGLITADYGHLTETGADRVASALPVPALVQGNR